MTLLRPIQLCCEDLRGLRGHVCVAGYVCVAGTLVCYEDTCDAGIRVLQGHVYVSGTIVCCGDTCVAGTRVCCRDTSVLQGHVHDETCKPPGHGAPDMNVLVYIEPFLQLCSDPDRDSVGRLTGSGLRGVRFYPIIISSII